MLKFCQFSLVGPCCYPPLVGLLVLIRTLPIFGYGSNPGRVARPHGCHCWQRAFGPSCKTGARPKNHWSNRDAPARHGPGDPEIYGTARHGKSWHGKILARPGTENIGTEKSWHGTARKHIIKLCFWGKYCWVEKSGTFCPDPKSHF